MKTCIACKHIQAESAYRYSSVTYGDGSISCNKGHFYNNGDAGDIDNMLDMGRANTCPDYELSDLAKSKGWTE